MPTATPLLDVRLLGPPLIALADRPIHVDTRKAIAILAYLVATDQPQSREHLAALLWPEADDVSARGALRRTLSTLKSALRGHHVLVERGSVRLDPARVMTDVWRVRDAASSDAVDDGATAAALRGEFLAGFALRDAPDFDDWTAAQAEAWRQRSITVLHRAADRRADEGDVAGAIEVAQRRVELDRLDEGGHRQLMSLHARAGDRPAALRQYRSCVRILSEELGVEPLATTTAVHEAILAGTVVAAQPTAAVERPATTRPLPLVGRDVELRTLAGAWPGGTARLLLIEGEPGIGKTRLADELAALSARGGRHALQIRGFPTDRATPYAPIVELLKRELVGARERLQGLDERVRAEVARLVPEAFEVHPAPLMAGPGAEARFTDALATVLRMLADGPLIVDDAQWVDPATLALVAQLTRRGSGARLLVAVCRRPVDAADDPLLPAIAAARRAGMLVEVDPRRLTAAEVGEVVARVGVAMDPQRLHDESAGVPFYVAERVAAILAGAPPEVLPAGIRDLVRLRVVALHEVSRQVLDAAAVIGGSFDPELARDVSGRSVDEVADALDELAAHRLVRARDDRLEIDHELTRTVVLDELGLGRRRNLHRRAADALAHASGRRRVAADIAAHLHAAGDDAAAAEWYAVAGKHATELHAHVEAIEHLEASLALAPEPDPLLHERIAERLTLLGRYVDAVTALGAAAAALPPGDAWRAELGLARAHRRLGNLALADAHLDAALASLGPDRSPERGSLLVEGALIADRLGHADSAATHADAALELALAHGGPADLAQAHNLAGLLARHRDEPTVARRHLEEALAIAAILPEPAPRMAALNNIALLDVVEGAPESAEARLRQAIGIATATADRHHEAALRNNLADVLNAGSRRSEAIAEVTRSAVILAELGGLAATPGELTPEVWRLVDW